MWQRLLPPFMGEGRDGGQQAHFNYSEQTVTHLHDLYLYAHLVNAIAPDSAVR